jgi:outer membrane protein insertion porin family
MKNKNMNSLISTKTLRWMTFATLLVTGLVPALADAAIASKIDVEGNNRIEVETVKAYMTIKEGADYSSQDLDDSLKSLYNSGLFSDVKVKSDGSVVRVIVVENPIINRIAIEGNQKIKDEDLLKEIQLKPKFVFTRKKVQADVQRLVDIYQKSGRYSILIEPKIIELDHNRVDLVFEINEGPPAEVRKILFIGNHNYSASTLEEAILTREWRWYRFLTSDDIYDADRVEADKEMLRRFYWNHGYADFKVLSVVAELSPDKNDFYLTFTIDEGEKYKFGNVDIETDLRKLDVEPLKKVLTIETGDRYNRDQIDKTINALTEAAGEQQYAFVDIHPRIEKNPEEKIVDITFLVEEGPKVFVERININGNVRTLDKVIRREIQMVEGDPFNQARLNESERRIKSLDFFEKVEVETSEGTAEDLSVVDVNVEEKSTGSFKFGVGYGTLDGPLLDVGLRERNLLGRGQDLALNSRLSKRKTDYSISFTEPHFMDRELAVGFDLFRTESDNSKESSFTEENTGATFRVGYPLTEYLYHTLYYSIVYEKVTDVKHDASRFIKAQQGDRFVSIVGHNFMYDRRDLPMDPTEGYYISLNQALAGVGGDVRYIQHRARAAYFIPIYEKAVLSFLAEGGHTQGIGQKVRLADRFFMGGDNMRGFKYGGLGPRDKKTRDALGGNWFYRFSSELSSPIGLPEEFGVKGHLFVDMGSLGKVEDKPVAGESFYTDTSPRVAVGAAVSMNLPIGPIRLEFTKAVVKESYDKDKVFRLTYSSSF